jgi:hypothetical protein
LAKLGVNLPGIPVKGQAGISPAGLQACEGPMELFSAEVQSMGPFCLFSVFML